MSVKSVLFITDSVGPSDTEWLSILSSSLNERVRGCCEGVHHPPLASAGLHPLFCLFSALRSFDGWSSVGRYRPARWNIDDLSYKRRNAHERNFNSNFRTGRTDEWNLSSQRGFQSKEIIEIQQYGARNLRISAVLCGPLTKKFRIFQIEAIVT